MPPNEAPAPSYEELVTLVAELRALNQSLIARVKELEDQLGKNSRNSSKPPSSDGFKKTKSLRQKSEKPTDGQKGHKGNTLELVEEATEILRHRVSCCTACGSDLRDEDVLELQRRQVFELPPLTLIVTEHQAEAKRCTECSTLNRAAFPEEVTQVTQYGAGVKGLVQYLLHHQLLPLKRTQELFFDLFKQPLSQGTLVNFSRRCYEELAEVEAQIKSAVRASAVIHVDETSCMAEDKRQWLHVCSTATLSFYALHPQRGGAALRDIGILGQFTGVAVHDAFAAYNKFSCLHALCNAHLLRELTFLYEQQAQEWAQRLATLLRDIKTAREASPAGELSLLCKHDFRCRYERILEEGFSAQPPEEPRPKGAKGRKKQSKAKNLLDRLLSRREEVLRFMEDPLVPFDNNQAERDLRMMKVQQKISGCFRGEGGFYFCRIRGYISTLRKQGLSILDGLTSVFKGQPLMPNL